jgi:hypothetical protein
MFGKSAGTGRGRNPTRKAPGTGMKAKTRRARDIIQGRKANKAAGLAKNSPYRDLMPKVRGKSLPGTPSEKLIKKTAAADRAKARAKAVKAGKTVKGTDWKKRKQARQARKGAPKVY